MRAKILNASAGSGKTYQLAYKYVHDVIERPESYSAILAVTFTNKATEEMKTRILKEINTLASGQRSGYMSLLRRETGLDEAEIRRRARTARTRILHNYSRFTVLTIDRFFQRILRAFIKELGIDLNYNIELETASVLTKSADALVEQITSDPELQRWLTDFVQERIDDGAKWDIRDGILALGDELFKERNRDALAAAGDKETLVRLVNEATTRSAASKRHFQAIGKQAVERMNQTGVTPESFKGGRNSFAQIFRKVAAGSRRFFGVAAVGEIASALRGDNGNTLGDVKFRRIHAAVARGQQKALHAVVQQRTVFFQIGHVSTLLFRAMARNGSSSRCRSFSQTV